MGTSYFFQKNVCNFGQLNYTKYLIRMKNLLTYFMPLTMLMLVGCGASGQDENQPAEESLCTIYISNNKGWEPLNVYLKDKENGTEYAGGEG